MRYNARVQVSHRGIPPHVAHHNSPGLPPPPDINFSQPPPGYIPVTPSYPPVHLTEIRTSISPSPAVELNMTSASEQSAVECQEDRSRKEISALSCSSNTKLPDLSKPPPGFPAPPQIIPEVVSDELMPSVPYFELPAGLMVPLIKSSEKVAAYLLDKEGDKENKEHSQGKQQDRADSEYRSLDPDSIRLPPPAPPSERLLAAVEAFYAPPCHDRPRDRRILDSEGWEKLGLYEYYRAKNAARRKKEEDIDTGIRERSKSPSPIVRTKSKSKSPPKKRYRSKSRSRSRSNSKPRSKSKSRSRSRTPPPRHYANRTNNNNNNNTNRRSPVRRPSRPYRPRSSPQHSCLGHFHEFYSFPSHSFDFYNFPFTGFTLRVLSRVDTILNIIKVLCAKLSNAGSSRWDWSSCPATERDALRGIPSVHKLVPGLLVIVSPFLVVFASGPTVSGPPKLSCLSSSLRSRSQSKSPSRSRSKSPTGFRQRSPERSPTPPSFLGSTYSKTEAQRQLDESNKGHQILCKMGWSGAGLGAKEQGIEQPISGGEVRDRTDMYKGVGINLNDPYENFRKSKGQAFINRMKARAEERL
uniref:G-patch domain-containing protein n=1 Tax=Timema poppense TaxID=170557 RepID=A0A7R9H1L6_TIMPO|nr:unnamed protein product [Timema poppensis]